MVSYALYWTDVAGRTHAHIGGDAANVDVSAALLPDDVVQDGLGHFLVVEEGRVGVDQGVDPLVHRLGVRVHLGSHIMAWR